MRVFRSVKVAWIALVLSVVLAAQAMGCTSVFVGKHASATGHILIARN